MQSERFVAVRATEDPLRWELTIEPRHLTHAGAMQGGCAFAAAIDAMTSVAQRPLAFASAQFVRHAGPTGVLVVDVEVPVEGQQTTQARARACVDGVEVLTAWGALGRRPLDIDATWASRPDVPSADDAQPVTLPSNGVDDLGSQLQVRLAAGRSTDELDGTRGRGRWIGWCHRLDPTGPMHATELAVLGDLAVLGISDAVGRRMTGNSIDNTLRIVGDDSCDWILVDVSVDAVRAGFAHVSAHLWADTGALLAIASQTLVVREVDASGRSRRSNRLIVGGGDG
jgi:acyl-CoA thioesterase